MDRLKAWFQHHFGELFASDPYVNLAVLTLIAGAPITKAPALTVAAGFLLALITLWRYLRGRRPDGVSLLIMINYGYWLTSAVLVGFVPLRMFANPAFWRWDGRIFFAFVPLLFFLSSKFSLRQARTLVTVLLVVSVPICLLGLAQYVLRSDLGLPVELAKPVPGGKLWEFHGLMKSHNAAGTFFGGVALTWIILLTLAWREDYPLPKSILLGMTTLVFIAFVFTLSRTGYLAFVAGFALLATRLIHRRIQWRLVGAIAVVLIAITALAAFESDVPERIKTTSFDDNNVSKRLHYWTTSIDLIPKSPIVGIGFSRWNDYRYVDNGRAYFKGIKGIAMTPANVPIVNTKGTPHNSYFAFAVETGLFGLGLVLVLWYAIWRRLASLRIEETDGEFGAALKLAAMSLVPFALAAALVGHALSSPATMLPFTIVAGLAIAAANLTAEGSQPDQ
ncbi:MAG TPA: O-antigen ligase family protein [Dehalococcoidia bacterium]|nr:O-antigen ligase family protein [Dehalococcoidia bacterium]